MMEGNKDTIGERIQEQRKKKGMTQDELKDVVSIAKRSYIAMWETGKREVKPEYIIKLADFFGVSCDYLLRGVEAENVDVNRQLGLSEDTITILKKFTKYSTTNGKENNSMYNHAIKGLNEIFKTTQSHQFFMLLHYYLNADFKEPVKIDQGKIRFKNIENGKFVFGEYTLESDHVFLLAIQEFLIKSREGQEGK